MADLNQQLAAIADTFATTFTLNDKPITSLEIFSEQGLLPAISRRADQLASLCLGYGIGVTFEEAEGSLLGVQAIFDDVTPNMLRFLCVTDVLMELVNSSSSQSETPLDELLYD